MAPAAVLLPLALPSRTAHLTQYGKSNARMSTWAA